MIAATLMLTLAAFVAACMLTWAIRRASRRLGAVDSAGAAGHVKAAARPIPNTGGIAVFLAVALPLAMGLVANSTGLLSRIGHSLVPEVLPHLEGVSKQSFEAWVLLCGILALHLLGVADDRHPLGPKLKLAVMFGVATIIVILTDTRLFTVVDNVAGFNSTWRPVSLAATVAWLVVVTNAVNFIDNMDGLCAGVSAICGSFMLGAALLSQQWFVAATLALLVGACCGFLVFNFPWRPLHASAGRARMGGASIFLGDGGSLFIGFLLAFLAARGTYYGTVTGDGGAVSGPGSGSHWYGVFLPLVVLAVPLYDFCSVTLIRIRQGKSPFVGDLQHFSHRLVKRGLSRRSAVLIIYGCTAVTAISGLSLATLAPWQALLVGAQTLMVLGVLALYEWRAPAGDDSRVK